MACDFCLPETSPLPRLARLLSSRPLRAEPKEPQLSAAETSRLQPKQPAACCRAGERFFGSAASVRAPKVLQWKERKIFFGRSSSAQSHGAGRSWRAESRAREGGSQQVVGPGATCSAANIRTPGGSHRRARRFAQRAKGRPIGAAPMGRRLHCEPWAEGLLHWAK